MRKVLTAVALVGGLAWMAPAHAVLTVTVTDSVSGAVVMTPTTDAATPGNLSSTGTNTNFSTINVQASGFPLQPSPNLATTTLNVTTSPTFTGPRTLTVTVEQTGIAFAGGNATSTFTFNGLIGAPGPATQDMLYNGAVIDTHTVASVSGVTAFGPDAMVVPAITTGNAERFVTTFTTAGQTYQGTIQFTSVVNGVPEPASLALLGSALAGLGFLGWRRRKTA